MTEKTQSQIQRMLQKVAHKFPQTEEPSVMTDIHVRINQETGDVMAFDDDDNEITRIVVDEWIDKKEDDDEFYAEATAVFRQVLLQPVDDNKMYGNTFNIMMPYCFVLEDELGEHIDELFISDNDDTIIIGDSFMEGLDKDLDDFMKHLFEE